MCKVEILFVWTERHGDVLRVEIDMSFDCNSMGEDSSHMFVPVLGQVNRQIELPMVLVVGSRRYRALRLFFWGIGKGILRHYRIHKILRANAHRYISYLYQVRIDYEEWMEKATLNLSGQEQI
ncbi:MAG: hypothetical protein LBT43_12235 [Prevotella sp.]|nr:hypothetical protein [Prevotella sp.]MDR2001464.1 hypothetical protein [Prevotella sp.]